jgi:hypothetical protein
VEGIAMKKLERIAARPNRLQAPDLAQVRGGGINGGGATPQDNGVIHMPIVGGATPNDNGVIHMDK